MSDNFYYKILGVPKNASYLKIRRSFEELQLFYHPELSDIPGAPLQYQLVSEAYYTLSNSHRRRVYDLSQQRTPQGTLPPTLPNHLELRSQSEESSLPSSSHQVQTQGNYPAGAMPPIHSHLEV